jgi:hypothetical protein
MKTINYIYETYNERGTKSFETKVKKELRSINLDAKEVIMHNAYWEKVGCGSYVRIAEIEIDGDIISLSDNTHDSWGWDAWNNPTSKDKRFLFLDILQTTKNQLV